MGLTNYIVLSTLKDAPEDQREPGKDPPEHREEDGQAQHAHVSQPGAQGEDGDVQEQAEEVLHARSPHLRTRRHRRLQGEKGVFYSPQGPKNKWHIVVVCI